MHRHVGAAGRLPVRPAGAPPPRACERRRGGEETAIARCIGASVRLGRSRGESCDWTCGNRYRCLPSPAIDLVQRGDVGSHTAWVRTRYHFFGGPHSGYGSGLVDEVCEGAKLQLTDFGLSRESDTSNRFCKLQDITERDARIDSL